ncbi:hypothetical protein Pelo_7574 [Pelomyxa schiedti]|nr:hypothetical protein Pelo_7574 [Pelomyxa schiedti]
MMQTNDDISTPPNGCRGSTVGAWGGRPTDPIAALVFGGHPRCGSRLTPGARAALSADGSLVARLLWSFVTETATNFVFREIVSHQLTTFSVSPLLLRLTREPRPHAKGGAANQGGGAAWWVSPTRWVGETRRGAPAPGFSVTLHDCGGGGGATARGDGEAREWLLWQAEDVVGYYVACEGNWRWFVGSVAECEGESGDGDALVRDRCGGMVGVVIMSVTGDTAAQPDPDRVVVPLSGECSAADYYVKLLSFSKSNSSEMLAVVLRKNWGSGIMFRNDPVETRLILFDVEGAYKSKSQVVVSETRVPTRARHRPTCEVIEVEEKTGTMRVLIDGRAGIQSLYRVSDSQFCLSFNSREDCEFLYQIWDCSGAVTSMVASVPVNGDVYLHCVAAAESGFLFTVEEQQMKVIDASSGVVVLCHAVLDGVWTLP